MLSNPQTRGRLAGLTAASIWGGLYVVSKAVLEVIPPFTLLSLRLMLGALALAAVLVRRHGWPRLSRGQWIRVLAIGMLGYGLSLGMQFSGTRLSTAANGAVVTAATPAFVYLFAWLLLRDRISPRRWMALALSTLGVLLVIDPAQARLSPDLWLGNLILVGAALTWALYSVLVRQSTQRIGVLAFTLVAFLGGMFVSLPLAASEVAQAPLGGLGWGTLAGVLYLGLVATALGAYLWNYAFETLDAGQASLTFFAQPLVGAALGVLFLGESLTPLFLWGTLLILFGLGLSAGNSDKIKPLLS